MEQTISIDKAFSKASKFIKLGDIEQALNLYISVLKKFPKNNRAKDAIRKIQPPVDYNIHNEIISLYEKGLKNEAITKCKKYLKIHPSDYELYNFLGIFHSHEGQLDEAERCYFKSLHFNSNSADTWNNLATTQNSLKKFHEAKISCEKALNINPTHPQALNNFGTSFMLSREYEESIVFFEKSLLLNPQNYNTLNNLGNSYQKLGLNEKAATYFKKSISMNNTNNEVYFNLASAYRVMGKFDLAFKSFERSLELKPNNKKAFIALVELSSQLDVFDMKGKKISTFSKFNTDIVSESEFTANKVIRNFIKNNNIQTELELKKLGSLIRSNLFASEAVVRHIEENTQAFVTAYHTFVSKLLAYNKKINLTYSPDVKKIYHLGESHCLTFAHHTINTKKTKSVIYPKITFGVKAWHIAQKKDNRFKAIFINHLKKIPLGSTVLISLGDIDCRINEGIIKTHLKTGKSIEKIISKTVNGYIEFIESIIKDYHHKVKYFTIPAPVPQTINNSRILNSKKNLNALRVEVVREFNKRLKNKVSEYKSLVIDTYSLTANEHGSSNLKYMIDEFHLSPSILPLIEEQI